MSNIVNKFENYNFTEEDKINMDKIGFALDFGTYLLDKIKENEDICVVKELLRFYIREKQFKIAE